MILRSLTPPFLAVCLFLAAPLLAQRPLPGTPTIDTPDFGPLPKEIEFPYDRSIMVLIPGGVYRVGDPSEPFEVRLGSFYIDKYEMSIERYMDVQQRASIGVPRVPSNKALREEGRPASSITWYDAEGYAKTVRKALPTEAEWMAAAQGPNAQLYPWGNSLRQNNLALGRGSYGATDKVEAIPGDVSPMGVHGMASNVSEWVADWYERDYRSVLAGQTDPTGPPSGQSKVVRGSNYVRGEGAYTDRYPSIANQVRDEIGFRTVYRVQAKPDETPTPTPPPTPTPTPKPDEVASAIQSQILSLFQDPASPPPAGLRVSRSSGVPLKFQNRTPLNVRLGFVDLESARLQGFPQEMTPMSSSRVRVPSGGVFRLFGYSPDAPDAGVVDLGSINSASEPVVVILPGTFNALISADGETTMPSPVRSARQHYHGKYTSMWNEFQIYNAAPYPIEVRLGPKAVPFEPMATQRINPGESLFLDDFPGTTYSVYAQYAAVSEDTAAPEPFQIKVLPGADHRAMIVAPNEASEERVRVITRQLPPLMGQVLELRP
ncbi:MAG: SUMF1/EgtB/PvdO family nonheme iron enzyme [Sumerlaeia bacterium]